ncbi:MAG: hypothetical protein HQL29_01825 [Candidatus Omnitrophica bacterium]|nr:hypothetical protein [Candidatus Omnitrophota bacterium]
MIIYEDILKEFQKQKVQYLIVGGLALNLLGAARATYDLDIIALLTDGNLEKIVKILKKYGYKVKQPLDPMQIADKEIREGWIRDKNLKAFNFYKDKTGEEVDIVLDIPVSFEKSYKNSKLIKIGTFNIRVMGIDDMIKMKKYAGREIDKQDIAVLKKIKNMEKKS